MKNKRRYLSGICVVAGIVLMLMSVMGGIRRHYIPPVERPIELVHDFGLVAAGKAHEHVFEIENPTTDLWSLAEITTSCRCAVPEFSWDAIPPGESAEVRLVYSAPDANTAETSEVAVEFHEKAAPELRLTAKAIVRRPMVPSHERLYFATLDVGQRESKRIVVRNFGEAAWRKIHLLNPPPWLAISTSRMQRRPTSSLEREQWAVDFLVTPTESGRSLLKAQCELVAQGIDGEQLGDCHITITAGVNGSVIVTPQELVIPRNRRPSDSFRLSVNFLTKSTANASDFQVVHGLGDDFRCQWIQISDTLWTLECFLQPDSDLPEGTQLTLNLKGISVEIPIRFTD